MSWIVDEAELPLEDEDAKASVFAVGNGAFCTRGCPAEAGRGAFRGTYVAGVHTRAGYGRRYPLLAPDWRHAWLERDGAELALAPGRRCLDLMAGTLTRSAAGPEVIVTEERFVSLADPALAGQRITVKADAPVTLHLAIDGVVHNHMAKYFAVGEMPNCEAEGLRLSTVTGCTWRDDGCCEVVLVADAAPLRLGVVGSVTAAPNIAVRREAADGRAVAVCELPAGEHAVERVVRLVQGEGEATPPGTGYAAAREASAAAWARFWEDADVVIEGDARAQRAVRFGIFATRIAAPEDGGRSSIGAKNLTGDWYLGAVFWDMEMYQLPMLAAVAPELAANHVRFRHRRLPGARVLAAQDGYRGARFPWHTFDTGLEDPPEYDTFLYQEIHLNAAVMWGVLHYHALAGDDGLMLDCGLELLAELARYFVSRASAGDDGELHLARVTGPDEEHQGVDDNAYTNLMVKRLLADAAAAWDGFADRLPEETGALAARLGLDADERAGWRAAADRLHVPRIPGTEVPAQYAGWAELPDPDLALRARAGHGTDRTNKQADTLMTWQALPDATDLAGLRAAWDVYAPLGNHTSSLSHCVHARLAARLGRARDAIKFFGFGLGVDLEDAAGNTCHGIHGAGQGGIWSAAVHGFGGLRVEDGGVCVDPQLPPAWTGLGYRVRVGGEVVAVRVTRDELELTNHGRGPARLRCGPAGEELTLAPGASETRAHVAAGEEPRLGGVILDLDGVLVTTDRYHYAAWKSLADELEMDFDETVNHQLRGVSRPESLKRIYAHNGRALPDDAEFTRQTTRKNDRYVELISGMGADDILPGAIELLDALRAAGIKTAIASASRNARRVLERCDLADKVDAVADGTIVTASKPDPQVFYLAAQRLGCLPWNCVGVEDAAAGIEAIHRAGMVALGIGQQTAPAAELVVDGVHQVGVDDLVRLWREHERAENPYRERNVAKMRAEEASAGKGLQI